MGWEHFTTVSIQKNSKNILNATVHPCGLPLMHAKMLSVHGCHVRSGMQLKSTDLAISLLLLFNVIPHWEVLTSVSLGRLLILSMGHC